MSSDPEARPGVATAGSVLAGLIGAGIEPSRTPALHEREGAAEGLVYIYKKIDLDVLGVGAEALPELLSAAERMGFTGAAAAGAEGST